MSAGIARPVKNVRGRRSPEDGDSIGVVVADGHPLTRLGLKAFVEDQRGMHLLGETGEEEELLRLVRDLKPDLVILDVNLKGNLDGLEICCKVKALTDCPRLLVHTAYDLTDDAAACLLAADAHLYKGAGRALFAATVRRMVATVIRTPRTGGGALHARGAPGSPMHRLTNKEREVAAMMVLRCSNDEMSRALHVSLPTVKTHVRSILRKVGAKSRRELFVSRRPGV